MASSVEQPKKLKLYSYWRSSCSFRVRIALSLKGLAYEYVAVDLLKGEHFTPEFSKLNPIGFVPVLVDGDVVISDSFAILMYLEEKYPQHPLLPADLQKKAINYQVASIVSSSIQPFLNGAMLKFIEERVGPDEKIPWSQHHITKGFTALEELLKGHAGRFATGDEVFLADLFLAPQINASVNNVDMVAFRAQLHEMAIPTQFPILQRLHKAYNQLPAFQTAKPENQPDATSSTTD